MPIEAPGDRGPLLASVVPAYSAETGLTEWGTGWQSDLAIQRFRPLGELDFATDDFTSPWGRLVAGTDGYYPAGLTSMVRVTASQGGWTALGHDGTHYVFDAADAVVTSHGTFMWMLSRVDTPLGDVTTLQWTRNASGRPFLASVRWGGRGDGTQYRMAFDYESVATPFLSYASGDRLVLDQRVTRVTIWVKQDGNYVMRWRYDLEYQSSPTGPAFYLTRITRTYASGASDPPITYDYDLGNELRSNAQLQHIAALDAVLAANGGRVLQPDHAALTDLEQDGLTDFETAFDQTTYRQIDGGFAVQPLSPADAANPTCRPSPSLSNKPRTLARMHGDAVEPQVVWVKNNPDGITTHLLVCDRLGVPIYDTSVAGNWGLNENTRLADLDRDHRPDIVHVGFGRAQVLRNTSSSPQELSFTPGPTTTLSPQFTPVATWVLDFNGDGRADLMIRHPNGVVVWLGTGGGQFEANGTSYGFITASGLPLANFSQYQLSQGDFNGDGLSDVILTRGQTAILFTNRGGVFVETPVTHLAAIPFTFSYPIVADLAGTGNEAVVFVSDQQASALDLTSPSTGLLRSADDGKGTALHFTYGRARPGPGLIRRYAVLAGLTVESSGYDTVSYSYEYEAPVLHTVGKYLIGFAAVDKHSPFLLEHLAFFNDDDVSGVHGLSEESDDRTPGVIQFTDRQYQDVVSRGVRWLRPSLVETGHHNTDGSVTLSTTIQYSGYQRDVCPTVTTTTGPNGQLVSTSSLASIAALPDELHCLPGTQTLTGTHADASLDFSYVVSLGHNDLGQVTNATQIDPSGTVLVLQNITYDADHRIATIGAPGRGTTTATYDMLGRLAGLTDPTGVAVQVDSVDPVSDALLALRTVRPDAPVTASFQYDGRERLQASWDDVSGASQVHPLASYIYQDATATTPGRIDTQTLADAITGTSRHAVALVAADGEPLVAGTWLGDHFSLGAASITTRTALSRRSAFIGTVSADALSALTSSDLRALGTTLLETTHAGFGHAIQTTTTQQSDVVGIVTTELALIGTELVTRVHEPGGFIAESAIDAAGKVLRKSDENGVVHRYSYDALGRLVHLDTPDGGHTLSFDGFGRPARVSREGIGAITYAYDATTGLLVHKQHLDRAGNVVDTSDTTYDALGRPTDVAQTVPMAGKDAAHLGFYYDGHINTTLSPGQLGRLSRVHGDGWERSALFDPLGRPYHEQIALTGWRDLTSDKTYRADGSVASDTLTITDAGGAVKLTTTQETVLDNLGRVGSVKVDGSTLYTLSYDSEGRLARADFTSGEAVSFDYDPVTHRRTGYQVDAPAASGGVHWDHSTRGLIRDEIYTQNATTSRRDYVYDGRGALTSATMGSDIATYSYTASGLPDTISDTAGSRSVQHTSSQLTVGDVSYTWDAAGRVVAKGEWTFQYGANGQLDHASRSSRDIDFVYDEADQRILKRINGVPVRANVAGGVLTEDHFVELVVIGDVVAGVLDNGQFTALLTDPRGTPFAGPDGTPGLASPYGVRSSRLGLAEVIDYTRLGWDPDLDVVRMGVRDYDPRLGQFLTPDPLYLENLEKCQLSPLQCSLYSYAGGNPISFVDPTGLGTQEATIGPITTAILRWTSGVATAETESEIGILAVPVTVMLGTIAASIAINIENPPPFGPCIYDNCFAHDIAQAEYEGKQRRMLSEALLRAQTQVQVRVDPWADTRPAGPKQRVNLDTSAIIGATQLSEPWIAAAINSYLHDKDLVATRTAIEEFKNGTALAKAGVIERTLAGLFLLRVTEVSDNPSARVLNLPTPSKKLAGKLGPADKIIFGTGDKEGWQTITSDGKFVKAAQKQGVTLNVRVFDAASYSGK